MDTQYADWKGAVERFWLAPSPDWRGAARLVADIAGESGDDELRQAASQALPSLRHASATNADRVSLNAARRRLRMVRDVLHSLTAVRFGKRGVLNAQTPEQRHRQTLGLPLGRQLSPNEIHQAFKRAAKTRHPDVGGDQRGFLELAAAREALMQPSSKRDE